MKARLVKVYAADRKTVLATVSSRCTSIGAAKKAGVASCYFGAPLGSYISNAWIATND